MPNSTINATTNGLNSTAGNVATLDLQVAGSTVASVGSTGISVTGTVSATGVSSFPAGSNTAPSITFTGDTNTGIYSPAADTIAFTEGGVEAMRLDSSGNVLVGTTSASTPSSTGFISTANTFGFKNRIINGDMRIDQRNAGASSASGRFTIDRWLADSSQSAKYTVQQNAGSVTPPAGFTNYLGVTSSSAYSVLTGDYFTVQQYIEGFNVADLGWGTANAKTVTLSFWVRSSLTGTFGGALKNSAENRSYPFTYTISAANTWEQKSITIAGDTSGTWLTNNGRGISLFFGLGVGSTYSGTAGAWAGSNFASATGATSVVGTNGATFYITGVQLEVGTVATSFDVRPYGTELALCQRYYFKTIGGATTSSPLGVGFIDTATTAVVATYFPVEMRTDPAAVETNGTASDYRVRRTGGSTVCSAVPSFFSTTRNSGATTFTVASGLTTGQAAFGGTSSANVGFLAWSAEL